MITYHTVIFLTKSETWPYEMSISSSRNFTFLPRLPMGLLLINGPEIALAADAKQNFQFWHIRMIKIPTNNTLG